MDAERALEILKGVTRTLTGDLSLEDALHGVLEASLELLPGDHASLRLLDESGMELLAGARTGTGVDAPPLPLRANSGVSGWVLEHGTPALIHDAHEDPRFVVMKGQGFRIRALMALPLWVSGRPMGVLSISASTPGVFGEEDLDLAHVLANCVVPIIEKARLERLAITDTLTRAFRQAYLEPRLGQEIERARRRGSPLSVLLMDLDHFKRINDEWGHAMGDRVLRSFADLVRENVRRYDTFVRRGGEEFILIMPEMDLREAEEVAERIRDRTESMAVHGEAGRQLAVTVSIGVALWDGKESAEGLADEADREMYLAKKQGRNRVSVRS